MIITAKFVNAANQGKKFGSIVSQDDTRFPCPAELVGKFLKGQSYDITVEQAVWDGKNVNVIRDVRAATPPTPTPPPANGGTHSGLTDAELRFISNVVGQAIVAKTITDPLTIGQWAKAARQTLKELG